MSKEYSETIADALTEAGLEIVSENGMDIKIRPTYLELKEFEWINSRTCYATLPDGKRIRVFFTEMENQVITHHD